MTTANRGGRPRDSWLTATAMLAFALVVVAALLNGVGQVGVMAPASPGTGRYLVAPELTPQERVPFARVDRAIKRLRLDDTGRAEPFEAYEPLLLALSESLSGHRDERALQRARLLLSRSLPAPANEDVSAMLPAFLDYQRAERALLGLSPGAPAGIEAAYWHLQMQQALRETILGESVADKLYRTSYLMTKAHLVRRLLMLREDLDEDEKRQLIRQQNEALMVQQPREEEQ